MLKFLARQQVLFTEGGEYEIPEEYDYIYFFIYNYV